MIDTHVHFWEYNKERDTWMDEGIRRDFMPKDIIPKLDSNAVDGVVAVQADQSATETDFLCHLAQDNPEIVGVIGWIDLLQDNLEAHLEQYKNRDILKGWRHIVQAEPKGFLTNPTFIENVSILGKYNYTYGILVYHNQLSEVLEFVSALPEQPLVLNHMGKPDLKTPEVEAWSNNIKQLAQHDNVYCKLSGLVTEAAKGQWTSDMLYRYIDKAIASFGTDRVMFGSDWPVMTLNSNYREWTTLFKNYITQFSKTEQHQILYKNAVNFYNLTI